MRGQSLHVPLRVMRGTSLLIPLILFCGGLAFSGAGDLSPTLVHREEQPPLTSSPGHGRANAVRNGDNGVGTCGQPAYQAFLPMTVNGRTGAAKPGFSLNVPECEMMVQGTSGDIQVQVLPSGAFSDHVNLALVDPPDGLSGSFAPATVQTGEVSTVTLTIDRNAATAIYPLTIRGVAGNQVVITSMRLVVVEPLVISGRVEFEPGEGIDGARVNARSEDGQLKAGPVTTDDGDYVLSLPVLVLPAKIGIEVESSGNALPTIGNFKWQTFTERGAVQMDVIRLPDPAGAEMAVVNGDAQSDDSALQILGLTSQVESIFGHMYDPDVDADLFPGEFAERVTGGQVPLNSSGFLWIVALDGQGKPVSNLAKAATIRARIPAAQWPDLEDTEWGTDRIETPIYTFNEHEDVWEQMGVGWLEDGAAAILAEEEQARILDGSFPGEIFATFSTSHFSFMNVDYAYYGPWTLSRMERDKRNNDCFFQALQLAQKIVLSTAGQSAYGNVNQPGADLLDELADGKGPEIKTGDLDWGEDWQTNGEYNGDNMVDDNPEDEILLNNKIWELCDDTKPAQKQDIVLLLASTILHETAHWKDDVKKHAGANDRTAPDGPRDTAGEEGKQLERDLFGGDLHFDPDDGRLELDGQPIDGSIKDLWRNPDTWEAIRAAQNSGSAQQPAAGTAEPSPLEITISMAGSPFNPQESIDVHVTYRNRGSVPIRVLDRTILEDYPLRFAITHLPSGKPVGFLGPELHMGFSDQAFVNLAPGETLQKTVDLNQDELGRLVRYNLRLGGQYQVKAVYTPFLGLPGTESNTLNFTLNSGGTISGLVTSLQSGTAISATLIYTLRGEVIAAAAVSNATGAYLLPDVPGGTYLLTTRAAGYQRTNQPNVVVIAGQNTEANLVLSPPPHLSYGQTVAGMIAEPATVYTYTISGRSGDSVLFRMAEVDPMLVPAVRLYRPDGTLLCESASSSIAQRICLLDRTGNYTMATSSFNSETGRFSLFVQRTNGATDATVISYGQSMSGTVTGAGAMAAYTFMGSTGDQVLLRLAEIDPVLVPDVRLYRPDGTLLCESASSSVAEHTCLLDRTGGHTILAGSFNSETGAFTVSISK